MFKRIVLATDFGESSRKASEVAMRVAKSSGGILFLVHAYELPVAAMGYGPGAIPGAGVDLQSVLGPIEKAAREELAAEAVRLGSTDIEPLLRSGAPWEEVLTVAKEKNADLIVVGSHGRRGLSRTLLGSVAEKIARLAEVPVLLVRETHPAK